YSEVPNLYPSSPCISGKNRHLLPNKKSATSFVAGRTRSTIACFFMPARSAPIRGWPILSLSRRPQRRGQRSSEFTQEKLHVRPASQSFLTQQRDVASSLCTQTR